CQHDRADDRGIKADVAAPLTAWQAESRVRAACRVRTDDLSLTRRLLWPTELRRQRRRDYRTLVGPRPRRAGTLTYAAVTAPGVACEPSAQAEGRLLDPALRGPDLSARRPAVPDPLARPGSRPR